MGIGKWEYGGEVIEKTRPIELFQGSHTMQSSDDSHGLGLVRLHLQHGERVRRGLEGGGFPGNADLDFGGLAHVRIHTAGATTRNPAIPSQFGSEILSGRWDSSIFHAAILSWCDPRSWPRVPLPEGKLWRYKVKNWLWLARRRPMK